MLVTILHLLHSSGILRMLVQWAVGKALSEREKNQHWGLTIVSFLPAHTNVTAPKVNLKTVKTLHIYNPLLLCKLNKQDSLIFEKGQRLL